MLSIADISVAALATAKRLNAEWLCHVFGFGITLWRGQTAARIPYGG
jgi:hypothetical protein